MAYDKALALKPDFAEAWLGRGDVFKKLKRHVEAFAAYDKALAIKPDLDRRLAWSWQCIHPAQALRRSLWGL